MNVSASLLVFTTLLATLLALELSDKSEDLTVVQGSPAHIQCTSDEPYEFCKWTHVESGRECRTSSDNIGQVGMTCAEDDHLEWDLDTHRCGLTIASASRLNDRGEYKCILGVVGDDDVSTDSHVVHVDVAVPSLVNFEGEFAEDQAIGRPVFVTLDQEVQVTCSASGGYPEPVLEAWLGNEPGLIDETGFDIRLDHLPELDHREESEDVGTVTSKRTFSFVPATEDCHKFVKCQAAQHDEEGNRLDFEQDFISRRIRVLFAPKPFEEPLRPFVFYDHDPTVTVVLNFTASPAPLDDEVIWHINPSGGDAGHDSIVLEANETVSDEDDHAEHFHALPLEVNGHHVSAVLEIHHPTPAMADYSYYLQVNTEMGGQVYNFSLRYFEDPLVMEEEHDDHVSQVDNGTTADDGMTDEEAVDGKKMGSGLVAVIVLLIVGAVVVVVIVFVAKKNHLCCFKYNAVPTKGGAEPVNVQVIGAADNEKPIIKNGSQTEKHVNESQEKDSNKAAAAMTATLEQAESGGGSAV